MITLKRSSGYTKLDLVVRAHDTLRNKINYGVLLPDGEIAWMIDDKEIGTGTAREAKQLFKDLYNEQI